MDAAVDHHACTIVARNYLALARVVSATFLQHHPGARMSVLILDDVGEEIDPGVEPFEVLRPCEIMEKPLFRDMSARYNVLELATAVKPWLLRHLLASGARTASYLDPDLCFYAAIDDVFHVAADSGIALTPHTLEPVPRDGRTPTETYLLQAGVFNLGFIAIGQQATEFLDWWSERLRDECVIDPANGRFVDQRWIDLVPAYFSHAIVRDPTLNVAYWNLANRAIDDEASVPSVGGRPLRFFHFSGFDPHVPERLSKHAGEAPRFDLSEMPAVQALCRDYATRLLDAGHAVESRRPYGLGLLATGVPFDDRMKRLYRRERGASSPVPDPWTEADAFLEWLRRPEPGGVVSRYLQAVYEERADVRAVFPDLRLQADKFLEWVERSGGHEEGVPKRFVAEAATSILSSPPAVAPPPGAVVAGYFRAEMGVGEAGRRILTAMEAGEIPFATMTYDRTVVRQAHHFVDRPESQRFPVAILCVNADQTAQFAEDVGPAFFDGRYTIGQWFWEVEAFPDRWPEAFDVVDEIWAGSEHIARALRPVTSVPVVTVPLPIEPFPPVTPLPKAAFGLEDQYTFLFTFDFLSVFERKNPLSVVAAFGRAFPIEGEAQLALKTTNADRDAEGARRLAEAISGRRDVWWIDEYFERDRQLALLQAADAYVSLHRSEGFGLTMAEAMAAGKPVVATGYSGNLEFMTEDTALLVPYTLIPIGDTAPPYPADAQWADPDVDAAAAYMRRLYDDAGFGCELGQRARTHIEAHHGASSRAELVRMRIELGAQRARAADETSSPPHDVAPVAAGRRSTAERIERLSVERHDRKARLGALTAGTRSALERLLYPLLTDLKGVLHDLARSSAGVEELDALTRHVDERVRIAATQTDSVRADVDVLRRTVDQRSHDEGANTTHKARVESHLAALTDDLAALRVSFESLRSRVDAVPYMAPDAPIRMVDDPIMGDGALGFRRDQSAGETQHFADIFRGPRDLIRGRAAHYVRLLGDRAPVLDIGCGRGELLQVLAEHGIEARGVDSDDRMVEACKALGLTAERADALEVLEGGTGGWGAVVGIHVIEHLGASAVDRFMRAAHEALEPGGLLVLETPNPNSIAALKTFWVDLTHVGPIFPEVALELARSAGFEAADIHLPSFDDQPASTATYADRLVTQGEYTLIARKAARGSAGRDTGAVPKA